MGTNFEQIKNDKIQDVPRQELSGIQTPREWNLLALGLSSSRSSGPQRTERPHPYLPPMTLDYPTESQKMATPEVRPAPEARPVDSRTERAPKMP